jgi:4-hydroxy-3-methylbut-2-enyl diphosphate reductase
LRADAIDFSRKAIRHATRLAAASGGGSAEACREREGDRTLTPRAPNPNTCCHVQADLVMTAKPKLRIYLCAPRGFCAGVVRAIDAVERALQIYGAPVYVRHEIVHNKYVVEGLKAKGAIFVEELSEVPDTDKPVIFSAHGVPKSIPAEAGRRNFLAIDATCPLVTKVHREAQSHYKRKRQVLLVGHAGHPEVVGTLGQLPPGSILLVQTPEDIETLQVDDEANLAYVTQTTLSVDDTRQMVDKLHERFPLIVGPQREDICYATTNRQEAVKRIAPFVDALIVVGSSNSSNSQRLKEVGERSGCPISRLVLRAEDVEWDLFRDIKTLGITAGASAPEVLVEEIMDAFAERFELEIEIVSTADESVFFPLPRELRPVA